MYPSEYDLQAIEEWNGTPRELIEFLDSRWEYNNNDWLIRSGRDGVRGTKIYRVWPSTWGWSGNEDIIGSLQGTWFWMLFWEQSRRGGHYRFQINPYWMDRKAPHGFGKIITKKKGKSGGTLRNKARQ